MATATIEKQHITRTPSVCGGKPCVAGTRIRVWDIYQWYERDRMPVSEIVNQYPQLSVADIHAALAYFFDHEEEIRTEMAEADAFVERMRQKHDSGRLRALAKDHGITLPR